MNLKTTEIQAVVKKEHTLTLSEEEMQLLLGMCRLVFSGLPGDNKFREYEDFCDEIYNALGRPAAIYIPTVEGLLLDVLHQVDENDIDRLVKIMETGKDV